MAAKSLLRTLDANSNRACEGLRVLEDIARFTFNQKNMCTAIKQMRHQLRALVGQQLAAQRAVHDNAGRNITGDVGTTVSTAQEYQRRNVGDLIAANAKRVQEALRVIEEHVKLLGPAVQAVAAEAEQLRYQSYQIEQHLQQLVPAQRLWQQKLYVLIDEDSCADSLLLAQQLAAIPVGIVQYRAKKLSEAQYYVQAARLRALFGAETLFIVNDYLSVAAAIRADGVHLGQDDADPTLARAALGPSALIGLSTHSLAQVEAAQQQPIDYIGIGPMFATQTKAHEPVRGPVLLEAAAAAIRLPSYAIGGINLQTLDAIKPLLPHGVAVAGAMCAAADPAAVYAQFQQQLDASLND